MIAAAAVTGVRTAFGCFGLVYFGLFVSPEVYPAVGSPPAVAFTAVGLALAVTASASLPGLLRGRRAAWHVLTCVITAMLYFNCYKILVEGETESLLLLAAHLLVAVLLVLPATRRHVTAEPRPPAPRPTRAA